MLWAPIPSALGSSADMSLRFHRSQGRAWGQLGPQGIGRGTESQSPEFGLSELVRPTLLVLHEFGDKWKGSPPLGSLSHAQNTHISLFSVPVPEEGWEGLAYCSLLAENPLPSRN